MIHKSLPRLMFYYHFRNLNFILSNLCLELGLGFVSHWNISRTHNGISVFCANLFEGRTMNVSNWWGAN